MTKKNNMCIVQKNTPGWRFSNNKTFIKLVQRKKN